MSKALIIPNTNLKLVDGSIVMISKFPNVKWIVHNGWYTYNSEQAIGWYLCSIPDKNIIPATTQDLETAIVVSNESGCCPCPPNPGPMPPFPPCPPCPPGPCDVRFTDKLKAELDAAFISVDTIADRNSLLDDNRKLPDGKLVRVNYIDDLHGPKYFRWDANSNVWKEETFVIDSSKFVTHDELSQEVESAILNWEQLSQ